MTEYYQIENGILERYTGRDEVIEIPEGIHTIGVGALKGCVSLKKVLLPHGLNYISPDAFKGCRKLEGLILIRNRTKVLYSNSIMRRTISCTTNFIRGLNYHNRYDK